MIGFIGREKELGMLESAFGTGCAILVYGRRRIGKTFLLKHFCEGKRHLFLTFANDDDNLRYMADAISEFTGEPKEPYAGIYDAFQDIAKICRKAPTVVVMDEYQFLAAGEKKVEGALSNTQRFIDGVILDTESMLILCGSQVRFMQSLAEDGSNPLYGRFKRTIRLNPMSFEECMKFHPGMDCADGMRLYLTVGGIPRYHAEMKQTTYADCIKENFLADGWMTEESENLIRAEFNPPDRHLSVLSSISDGAVSLKAISDKVGVNPSTCSGYLRDLEKAGIVGTLNPMKGAPKRSVYYVADHMMAFHYGVMTRRRNLVSNSRPDVSYEALRTYIDTHLGARFELFCKDFIVHHYPVTEIGRWWIDNQDKGLHEDIDVVARVSSHGNIIDLFAECKFTRRPVGFHEYNILDRRVREFMGESNPRLALMSLSGFDRDLEEFAEGAHLLLIGPDELFGRRAPDDMV